jgi:tetratricopeptide (TPR) repeat protein
LTALPGSDPLIQAFPDVTVGEAFIATALERSNGWEEFSALAIRIEFEADAAPAAGRLEHRRLSLGRVLAALCKPGKGTWGVLDPLHLACFLAGDNASGSLESAREIQQSLEANGGGRVTLGVARYPMIDFQRDQILDNAFKALDHAEFIGPGSRVAFDAVSLNISGDKRYDAGDIAGAVEEYRRGLLLDPDNVNIHNSLGVCYGVQGDLAKALEEFSAAMRLDGQEVMAVYNTGLTYTLRKEIDQGLLHLKKAAELDDSVFEVCLQLGRVCLDAGDTDGGRHYLEKARSMRPESSAVLFYLGECHNAADRQKEAVAAYQAAIKNDPGNAAALSALGRLYDRRGENREIALMFCEQSVKIAPDNPLFYFRLGRLYLKHGRLEEARAALKTAAELGHDVDSDPAAVQQAAAGESGSD